MTFVTVARHLIWLIFRTTILTRLDCICLISDKTNKNVNMDLLQMQKKWPSSTGVCHMGRIPLQKRFKKRETFGYFLCIVVVTIQLLFYRQQGNTCSQRASITTLEPQRHQLKGTLSLDRRDIFDPSSDLPWRRLWSLRYMYPICFRQQQYIDIKVKLFSN